VDSSTLGSRVVRKHRRSKPRMTRWRSLVSCPPNCTRAQRSVRASPKAGALTNLRYSPDCTGVWRVVRVTSNRPNPSWTATSSFGPRDGATDQARRSCSISSSAESEDGMAAIWAAAAVALPKSVSPAPQHRSCGSGRRSLPARKESGEHPGGFGGVSLPLPAGLLGGSGRISAASVRRVTPPRVAVAWIGTS
jgi:hypothetical protein